MSDEMREAFEAELRKRHWVETHGMWEMWQAAIASKPQVTEMELVDVQLLNDAITLITKSLAGLLTDTSFASPYAEDHRPTTPRWVIAKFAHDYERRVAYVNDIKQRLDWIRNATAKLRERTTATIRN